MKSRSILLFIFTFFFITVNAQIADEIKSYVDSTEIFYNNGRKMLLESLTEGDYLKSGKVYFYLKDDCSKNNCVAFDFWEEQSILVLLGDWNTWLDHAANITKWNSINTCYNYNEKISDSLVKLEYANANMIRKEVESLKTDIEQKDLLNLYLIYLTKGTKDIEYNRTYNSYKSHYKKNSRYFVFFTEFFPPVKNEISMSLSVGPTFVMPYKGLSSVFKMGTVIDMSYDINIGNVYTSLFINGGPLPLIAPITFKEDNATLFTTINVGETFHYYKAGVAAGYYFIRNNHIKLAPIFSIAAYSIESKLYPEDSKLSELEIVNSFSYGPGIHTEVKIFSYDVDANALWYGVLGVPSAKEQQYIGIKLDAGYDIIHKHNFDNITGNSSYLRIGLVWGMGGF